MEIVAHRGASYDAPENTIAAFQLAWEQAADAIELDIRITKDKRIVALHDDNTHRTTGVRIVTSEATLDELHLLDAGSWKAPSWKSERIPTLAEAIATVPTHGRIYIEIKCGVEILPVLQRELAVSGIRTEQVTIMDFNFGTLVAARPLFPEIELLFLHGGTRSGMLGKHTYPRIDDLAEKARSAGLNGINLRHSFPITAEAAAHVKLRGLKFSVWTVDSPADACRLAAAGVDAITTNRLGVIREAIKPCL